jgi:hypothetical protein
LELLVAIATDFQAVLVHSAAGGVGSALVQLGYFFLLVHFFHACFFFFFFFFFFLHRLRY